MKEIIIRVRDDLDGSRADETVEYTWRGQAYEIDLSIPNVAEFEKDMQRWLAVSRPVVPPVKPRKRASASADPSVPTQRAIKAQRKAIREWARANGMDVQERGHIQRIVVEAYQLAHPHERVFADCYPNSGQSRGEATSVRAQELSNGEVAALELFAPKQLPAAPATTTTTKTKTADHHKRSGATAHARSIPDKARRDEIRQWARDNGFDVSPNGYIRGEIVAAFETAHERNGEKVH